MGGGAVETEFEHGHASVLWNEKSVYCYVYYRHLPQPPEALVLSLHSREVYMDVLFDGLFLEKEVVHQVRCARPLTRTNASVPYKDLIKVKTRKILSAHPTNAWTAECFIPWEVLQHDSKGTKFVWLKISPLRLQNPKNFQMGI